MDETAAASMDFLAEILGGLAQPFSWVWGQFPYATPLLVLVVLAAMRLLGWHLKFLPSLAPVLNTLTKSPDLTAAFPGACAQRRLRLLLGADSGVRTAMQLSESTLARWFGPHLWSAQALNVALLAGNAYPVLFLILVWVGSGNGYLGTAQVLPGDTPMGQRLLWLLAGVSWVGLWASVVQGLARSRPEWHRRGTATVAAVAAVGVPFVVPFAFPFAGAGDVAFAVAVAVTFAILFTGAVAVAAPGVGAVVVAGAGAGAVAMAVVGTAAAAALAAAASTAAAAASVAYVIVASAGVVAAIGAVSLAALRLERFAARRPASSLIATLTILALFLMVCAWAAPVWTSVPGSLDADRVAFVVLVFVGLLPLWNAALDVVSVGVTRYFLRRYLATGRGWLWMSLLDIAVALLVTAVLFWGVIAGFSGLQQLGWGVDAAAMARRFRDEPTSSEVSWILWMAMTNLAPSALHLGLATAGVARGWLLRDEALAATLRSLGQPVQAGVIVGANSTPLTSAQPTAPSLMLTTPLQPAQAHKLVNWVYVDFWLAASLPWCALVACWPVFLWLMHTLLGWLV